MSKKTIYILIGAAVALITLLIVLSKTGAIGAKDEGKEIETSNVDASTIIETVSATGKIQPEIEVKIASMVSGEIIELPIKEGQVVKKGDLLVADTNGWHRGMKPVSNDRTMLTLDYVCHDEDFDSSRRFQFSKDEYNKLSDKHKQLCDFLKIV